MWGDVLVFQEHEFRDKGTWDNPAQFPVGLDYVLVNGQVVLEDGKITKNRPGRMLLHNQ